jgi:hypothetical protein
MRDGGKGDKQRPLGVPPEQFNSNWDSIFKKPKQLKSHYCKEEKGIVEFENVCNWCGEKE